MAAGRERRAAAETFTARWKKQWHRARVGVRRAAVDYFRGNGSDWVALAGLLLTIPLFTAGTLANSVWCPPAALVLPIVARSEEHTSELQSRENLVCRLLLEKK